MVVGKSARSAVSTHPDLVAQWVKRDMGAPFYSHPIRGQYLPPEVIQACILRKLKLDVDRRGGARRRDGHHRAGLFRRAAPQGHRRRRRDGRAADHRHRQRADRRRPGLRRGRWATCRPPELPREQLTVMVYDLGGGTFDVTLLKLAAGKVQTLATDGDVQLGGHDWDQRLVDHVGRGFRKQHQLDPRDDPAALEPPLPDRDGGQARPQRPQPRVDPRRVRGPGGRGGRHSASSSRK